MPDPRETLARIRKQADAATDGPWAWASRTTVDGDQWAVFDKQDHALAENRDGWGPDAEFIAAARTTVPRLVDALEAVLDLADQLDRDGNAFMSDADPGRAKAAYAHAARIRTAATTALEGGTRA